MTQTAHPIENVDAARAALTTALAVLDQQAAKPATLAAVAAERQAHASAMRRAGHRPMGDPMTGDHNQFVRLAAAFGRLADAFEGREAETGVREELAVLAAHALAWLDTLDPELYALDDEPPF